MHSNCSFSQLAHMLTSHWDTWRREAIIIGTEARCWVFPQLSLRAQTPIGHMNVSNTHVSKYGHRKLEVYLRAYIREDSDDDSIPGWPDLYCKSIHLLLSPVPLSVHPLIPSSMLYRSLCLDQSHHYSRHYSERCVPVLYQHGGHIQTFRLSRC